MSKSFGRYVEISGTSHALLHYGIKRTPVMSGELKFADSNSMDVYGFSLANATPDRLIITEERITWHRKGEKKPYEIALEPNFKESALAECEDPVAKLFPDAFLLQGISVSRFIDRGAATSGLSRRDGQLPPVARKQSAFFPAVPAGELQGCLQPDC